MFRRTITVACVLHSSAWAGEPKWEYSKLVDAPIAPSERQAPVKIVRVSAELKRVEPPEGNAVDAVFVLPEPPKGRVSSSPSETWRVFVGGEVQRVGSFTSARTFTALQAVIAAGGPTERGATRDVVVLRYGEKNAPPKASRIDLSQSLAGKGTSDLWLETHDVVIVPKAGQSTEDVIRSVPPPLAEAARERTIPAPQLKPVSKQTKK